MKIVLEVPDNKVSFIMELIESMPFIELKKTEEKLAPDMDTTEYLLSSASNRKRILEAIDRTKSGEVEYHNLIEE